MQREKDNEEKRKQEDLIRRDKNIMIEKFEKITKKNKINKNEFYKEVFSPINLKIISNFKMIYLNKLKYYIIIHLLIFIF